MEQNQVVVKSDLDTRLQSALNLPRERKVYFNGFAITISPADVLISLEDSGEAMVLLHAPHSVAKTLIEKLGTVISEFEKNSGYSIPTLGELEDAIKKNAKPE